MPKGQTAVVRVDPAEARSPRKATWAYEWNGAGLLARVVRPNGHVVEFGYDPLARRTFKKYRGKTTKRIWDGNVPLHEWVERDADAVDKDFARPTNQDDAVAAAEKQLKAMLAARPTNGPPVDAAGTKSFEAASGEGTVDAPVTWVFEPESFAPLAKIVDGQRFGIVTDHLGTPCAMFDGDGREVWGADIDAFGDLRNLRGERAACPFRWPGQYEDEETGLYYNRFRYYSEKSGQYVSLDPIGLVGGANISAYVRDPMVWTDPLGLAARIGDSGLFSKSHEFGRGSGSGSVDIPLQGSRSRDFAQADKEFARLNNGRARPADYTWHHANYDPAREWEKCSS